MLSSSWAAAHDSTIAYVQLHFPANFEKIFLTRNPLQRKGLRDIASPGMPRIVKFPVDNRPRSVVS
jgi:hypothetical protein